MSNTPPSESEKIEAARPTLPVMEMMTALEAPSEERVDKVPLTLTAIVATTQLTLADVTRAQPGHTIEFDQSVDDPAILTINGRPVAEAEVMTVGDFWSVRIIRLLGDA